MDSRARGVTLIELVASAAIIAIISLALGSTMLLAVRANQQAAVLSTEIPASQYASQVAEDLREATAFVQRSASDVTFTVPDRTGDGVPETIRYAWSGTAGDPLVYQFNNSAPITLAMGIENFDIEYLLRSTPSGSTGSQEQESSEMLLIYHQAAGGNLNGKVIRKNKGAAQYFKPTLPTNTTKWKITKIRFWAKKNQAATGLLNIRITGADAAMKPTGEVLDSAQLPESSLIGNWRRVEISFGALTDLDPSAGYCLVILDGAWTASGEIRWERNGSPMTPNAHYMTTDDGGSTWSDPVDDKDMLFEVYGTVTTTGEPQWP